MRTHLFNYSSLTTPFQVQTGMLNQSGADDANHRSFRTCSTYECFSDIFKASKLQPCEFTVKGYNHNKVGHQPNHENSKLKYNVPLAWPRILGCSLHYTYLITYLTHAFSLCSLCYYYLFFSFFFWSLNQLLHLGIQPKMNCQKPCDAL